MIRNAFFIKEDTNLKPKFKKIICLVTIIVVLTAPMIVYAKSYTTTFNFVVATEGESRKFDKGSIKLKITSTEEKNGCRSGIKTFNVTLYRKGFFTSTEIGSFSAVREGTTKNSWKNMASGKYFLYLSKANDMARVKGDISITQ